MDFERLISTEKSTIAVKTIRKKCSVITFIFTFVVLVVLIIMFATTSHRLDSIESTLTRVDRTEQADAETLSHKLQKVEEEEVELLGVAPKLTTKPQPLRLIVEDSDYNLTCEATGSPLPNITWARLVGSIPSSWDQQDGVLFIKGFKMHDSGNYYCKARNSLGEAIAHTTLNYMKKEAFKATFTTLGASGRFGPTHVGDHYNGQDHMGQVTVKKGIQIWVVPFTGRYEIQAVGASGGYDFRQDSKNYRGRGARMFGTFELRQGDLIHILVGHEGGCNFNRPYTSTAGGGGTFVSKGPSSPLIVAGGGGGYDSVSKRLGAIDASSNANGMWAYGLGPGKNWMWKGGEDGLGAKTGLGTYTGGGGGGGGFYSSGGSSKSFGGKVGVGGQGGDGFLQGGKGGQSRAFKVYGGFGGGGGADGGDASKATNGGGGGGGGYSGGAAGANYANSCGGGGGSFNTGMYPRDYGAYNDKGHGYVIVTLV